MAFWASVREDINSVMESDPAATSRLEVFLCYSGLHAVWAYRFHHWLWRKGLRLLPRLLSQFARWMTQVEIHSGAEIGRRLFIDHGSGVVIGETSIVGDDVTLYQGVTLGGTGKATGKRHPTIRNNVVVGGGAKILGNITVPKQINDPLSEALAAVATEVRELREKVRRLEGVEVTHAKDNGEPDSLQRVIEIDYQI
jgi:serine O-acetyltransferase